MSIALGAARTKRLHNQAVAAQLKYKSLYWLVFIGATQHRPPLFQ